MSVLIELVRAVGRFFGRVRDLLAQVFLALVYLFGVGLMALGRLVTRMGHGKKASGGFRTAQRPDLTRDGLGRMG